MKELLSLYRNEKGMVLITALFFLGILLVVSTTAYLVTTTDLKIGGNYKANTQALYTAESGIAEALARLRGTSSSNTNYAGDPVAGVDPWWSAFILTSGGWQTSDDPNYDVNYKNYIPLPGDLTNTTINASSLQSDLTYFAKTRHKTEYDAEQDGHTVGSTHYYDGDGSTSTHTAASPGNVIYYGYGDPAKPTTTVQFTTAGPTAHKPAEIITAYGTKINSSSVLEVEAARTCPPPVTSALYAKGNVTGNGSAMSVDGNDNCGSAPGLPPIYTLAPATTTLAGGPVLTGNPAAPVSGPDSIDIDQYVDNWKGAAGTVTITSDQNGINYGNGTNFVTCYSDTSNPFNVGGLKLQNITGYGILLVEGDLTLGGGFDWNGLVLVTGILTFNGGGAGVNIRGAVLANQTVAINGGLDIRYDSCMIDSAINNKAVNVIKWKQIY
jgi:hypothetical protein